MINLVLPVLLLLLSAKCVASLPVSWKVIQEKLQAPMPEWMKNQITKDFSRYKSEGVSEEMIDFTYRKLNGAPLSFMIRYKIVNNRLTISGTEDLKKDWRVQGLAYFLREMVTHLSLPNVDFLVSHWDCFDHYPLLEETYCPVFTISKKRGNTKAVLIPEVWNYGYRHRVFQDVLKANSAHPWEKKQNIALWRGISTGGLYTQLEWDMMPRSRLVIYSLEHPELVDARLTGIYWAGDETRKWIEGCGLLGEAIPAPKQLSAKYLIAVQGNSFPTSLRWQLLSNSVVLKDDSEYLEWFYEALIPYVHYVPYHRDCHDLGEVVQWLRKHDKEAKRIAENATQFYLKNLTFEDIVVYLYHLLVTYSEFQTYNPIGS